jgi:hypothetical protein
MAYDATLCPEISWLSLLLPMTSWPCAGDTFCIRSSVELPSAGGGLYWSLLSGDWLEPKKVSWLVINCVVIL